MDSPTVPTPEPDESNAARVAPYVCHASTSTADVIGAPCRECGHTNLAHPGNHNPTLDACAICLVLAAAEVRP